MSTRTDSFLHAKKSSPVGRTGLKDGLFLRGWRYFAGSGQANLIRFCAEQGRLQRRYQSLSPARTSDAAHQRGTPVWALSGIWHSRSYRVRHSAISSNNNCVPNGNLACSPPHGAISRRMANPTRRHQPDLETFRTKTVTYART